MKDLHGEAKVDFDTVTIARGGNNLRLKPVGEDGWVRKGALPEGFPATQITHVDALRLLLAFSTHNADLQAECTHHALGPIAPVTSDVTHWAIG
jgi:hypothetical protein